VKEVCLASGANGSTKAMRQLKGKKVTFLRSWLMPAAARLTPYAFLIGG